MKRISVALVVLSACFASSAWGQQIICPPSIDWTEFHTIFTAGYNPCETVLNVDNVGGLQPKWTDTLCSSQVQSAPTVVNGMVYFSSGDNSVDAYGLP